MAEVGKADCRTGQRMLLLHRQQHRGGPAGHHVNGALRLQAELKRHVAFTFANQPCHRAAAGNLQAEGDRGILQTKARHQRRQQIKRHAIGAGDANQGAAYRI